MQWYQEVFGGELTMSTFAELHGSMDPSEDDLIMHSDLQGADGIRFMASDVPSRMEYAAGTNNFSMSLSGEDDAQLRGYFDKLSNGGTVLMPLEKAAWGDTFGMCTDRFGVTWLINVSAPSD
jgi:PhnB protein